MATVSSLGMKNQAFLTLMLNNSQGTQRNQPKFTFTNIVASIAEGLNAANINITIPDSTSFGQNSSANLYKTTKSQQQTPGEANPNTSGVEVHEDGSISLAGTNVEPDSRLEKNLKQAQEIIKQLNLTDDAWAIESLARDLAVFDLDFTAIQGNPHDVNARIQDKSKAMLAEIDREASKTGAINTGKRREITGAAARLASGMSGAAAAVARASVSVNASAKTTVVINGQVLDGTAIVEAGKIVVDPLVFDLNGDGINMKSAEDGVEFDMNGDGQSNQMGFIQGDDALLFLDTHGDGLVHDGRQLFGNQDGYANGFEMLRAYDSNGDGIIDENDEIFDQLRLWVDKNPDGTCQEGETMTLREAGITSINLNYENVREDDGKGNLIGQTGSFTRSDGTEGYAADVWFHELAQRPEGY